MAERVFAALSMLYVLVVVGMVLVWRDDKRLSASRLREVRDEVNTLKVQLNVEREGRRALEGYYVLEDSANLDPEWRAVMAWADSELAANDNPEGRIS